MSKVSHKLSLFKKVVLIGTMLGAIGAVLVPYYAIFGKKQSKHPIIGTNTTSNRARKIRVQLSAQVLPAKFNVEFKPMVKTVEVHPGQTKQVYFYIKNDTGRRINVRAIPKVVPGASAKYIKKTPTYCLPKQTFYKNEKINMPVIFRISSKMPKFIKVVGIQYTLINAKPYLKG